MAISKGGLGDSVGWGAGGRTPVFERQTDTKAN